MASVDILSMLNKSGSGINLKDLSTSLAEAATVAPKNAAQAQIDHAGVAISALGSLRAQMSGMAEAVAGLIAADPLGVRSSSAGVQARVSDRAAVTATANRVEVIQLAQSQVLEFAGHGARDEPLPAGRITLDVGVWYETDAGTQSFAARPGATAQTIDVAEGTTLSDLARQLARIPGLSAAVIDKGDGTFSLGVVGQPGAGNALRLTVEETVPGSGLAQFDTTTRNAEVQVQGARNAALVLDGVTIQRDSNVISDAIPGVELTLTAAGAAATISAGRDAGVAEANIRTLVTQLNAMRTMLSEMGARAVVDAKAGPMAGDAALRQITQGLDALLRSPIAGYADKPLYLADFGIRTGDDGNFHLDQAVFTKAFAADPARFDALFSDRLEAEGVAFSGPVPPTFLPGSYSFRRDAATGVATLDGQQLAGIDLGDGRSAYSAQSGPARGMILTVDNALTQATVTRGRSFLSQLADLMTTATAMGGTLDTATQRYQTETKEAQTELDQVTARAKSLQDLYTRRFAVMEQAVTRFHSTSSFLDSLVAQWNKKE